MNRYPYLKGILMNKELEASETLSYRMYQNISSPGRSWPLGQNKEVWSMFSASGRSAWSLRLSFQPSGWSGRCFLRLSLVSKEQVAAIGTALWKVKNFRWGTLATQEIELHSSLCNWFYFQIFAPSPVLCFHNPGFSSILHHFLPKWPGWLIGLFHPTPFPILLLR